MQKSRGDVKEDSLPYTADAKKDYGMAEISGLLKFIGLFCKRAL